MITIDNFKTVLDIVDFQYYIDYAEKGIRGGEDWIIIIRNGESSPETVS